MSFGEQQVTPHFRRVIVVDADAVQDRFQSLAVVEICAADDEG